MSIKLKLTRLPMSLGRGPVISLFFKFKIRRLDQDPISANKDPEIALSVATKVSKDTKDDIAVGSGPPMPGPTPPLISSLLSPVRSPISAGKDPISPLKPKSKLTYNPFESQVDPPLPENHKHSFTSVNQLFDCDQLGPSVLKNSVARAYL
jgi:hypothetical protein